MKASCIDCKSEGPEVESDYSLIGAGWRLIQHQDSNGSPTLAWRCPRCWANYRKLHGLPSGSPGDRDKPAKS